jgi:hypothetical protein
MTVQLIRYRLANAVPRVPAEIEYEEGKVFNVRTAARADTPQSKVVGDGTFAVDGEKEKELVKALDKSPTVYRAGGEAPGSAGESFD